MGLTKECIIKCPHCKAEQETLMPNNSNQIAFVCSACRKTMLIAEGDCCVFCSYGSIKCLPKQANLEKLKTAK
jgi:hypothetical protein